MKKVNYIKLLMLVCFVMSFGMIITSCDDDDEKVPNSGMPELLSFGPSGVQHGEDIRFIGRNLNLVDAIELPGVTVPKSAFKSQTSELIVLTVPQETMEGVVTLKTAKGDVTSKTILSFEVPITITEMTAEARPGANITIKGTKLNWVKGVMFESVSDTVKTFVSQSATEMVVQVPATAKTGPIVLLGGGTEPAFVETEEDLVVTLPVATAVAPATLYNGQNLTITGTDLDLVKEVWFKGSGQTKVTEFISQSPTELVVTVPANAVKGAITLMSKSGVEVPTTHEVTMVLPAVTAVSPSAVKHQEKLTITGTDLDLVKEVKFKGVGAANVDKADFVSQSTTQLEVMVPKNASKGVLTLVANSGATVTTTQEVTITLPVITSVSPSPVDPGQQLTINGTNLDLVKSIEFKDGAVANTFVSKSPTQIVVVVPMTAQRGALKLTTTSDYVVETDAQVLIILPVVKEMTPEPVIPGNFFTLTGTDLNLVKSVTFTGGVTVSTFVAQNSGQIVLTVPAGAKTGVLELMTHSNFKVTTTIQAQIGTAEPPISTYIYRDALNGWDQWGGWGLTTQDVANTENVSRGTNAIKLVYNNAYGALQLHPKNANALAGNTHLVFYVRGTVDSRVAIQVKNKAGAELADVPFDVKAGEYKLIEIPISSLGDISSGVEEIRFKNYGTNPNTIYLDDIGLR